MDFGSFRKPYSFVPSFCYPIYVDQLNLGAQAFVAAVILVYFTTNFGTFPEERPCMLGLTLASTKIWQMKFPRFAVFPIEVYSTSLN